MFSVLLAVLAALIFAMAAAFQHFATRTTALAEPAGRPGPLPVLGLLPRLVRNRIWLLGFGLNLTGFVVHAMALHYGRLAIVQTVLVTQLLFALPFAALRAGGWPLPRDWIGTAFVCAGLAALLRGGEPTAHEVQQRSLLPVVILAVVGVMTLLVGLAWLVRRHAQTRTALVGVAAGSCFCVTAILITEVASSLFERGPLSTVLDWPLYGLIASGVTAAILVQESFASGSFPTALTSMTIADPSASWVAGAVLAGAAPAVNPFVVLAAAGIIVGVVLLAYSPTLHDERTRPPARGRTPLPG